MTERVLLTLFGREYCGLCQQMREELHLLAPDLNLDVIWFDIDDDDAVEARYTEMVPVLTGLGDEVICFYHLDRYKLEAYLARQSLG
ncbi:glutaredoxin family protein [Chitinimonas sp. BJB300]|uniref:glutaredoxin family protein n=1 Tax=Chitinimonas sp. BJB300 TaxID=1559339 RepID=UPI000C0F8E9B|nr:glutaredoxin family protein [Chitinimonas sp. BJB300]PHV11581.1 thioredoxin family protein [Chitinimonas sp. BJB300]TSJ88965.1 glutaredoxin family protein [Chitinimonas sp. BJB300]